MKRRLFLDDLGEEKYANIFQQPVEMHQKYLRLFKQI